MDPRAIKTLEDIRKHTPRYLFRSWSNSGTLISGGYVGLNTTKAITPLAFARERGAASVYDLTALELFNMARDHLAMNHDIETQLSSWTHSLSFAMESELGYKDKENTYISIIDTEVVRNPIFYVRSLDRLCPGSATMYRFDWEFLAHGVIESKGLCSVSLQAFRLAGFKIEDGKVPNESKWFPINPDPVMCELVYRARKVGELYKGALVLPMTLALICRDERNASVFRPDSADFRAVLDGLVGLHIPDDWRKEKSIMTDIVDVHGWVEVEQLIRLMRAIAGLSKEDRDKMRRVERVWRSIEWTWNGEASTWGTFKLETNAQYG